MAKLKSNVPKLSQAHLLTPDQAALRCFAALRPDQENCADVMRFLQTVVPYLVATTKVTNVFITSSQCFENG